MSSWRSEGSESSSQSAAQQTTSTQQQPIDMRRPLLDPSSVEGGAKERQMNDGSNATANGKSMYGSNEMEGHKGGGSESEGQFWAGISSAPPAYSTYQADASPPYNAPDATIQPTQIDPSQLPLEWVQSSSSSASSSLPPAPERVVMMPLQKSLDQLLMSSRSESLKIESFPSLRVELLSPPKKSPVTGLTVPVTIQACNPLVRFALGEEMALFYFQIKIIRVANSVRDVRFPPLVVGFTTRPIDRDSLPPGFDSSPPIDSPLGFGLCSQGDMMLDGQEGALSGVAGMAEFPFWEHSPHGGQMMVGNRVGDDGMYWKSGDVIGCKIDAAKGIILWHVNGELLGPVRFAPALAAAAGNNFYPTISLLTAGDAVELQFSSSKFDSAAAAMDAIQSPEIACALLQHWNLPSLRTMSDRSLASISGFDSDLGLVLDCPSSIDPVKVERVVDRSAAYSAGLKAGDTIVSINGQSIKQLSDATRIIRGAPIVSVLHFVIHRPTAVGASDSQGSYSSSSSSFSSYEELQIPLTLGLKGMSALTTLKHARWIHAERDCMDWRASYQLTRKRQVARQAQDVQLQAAADMERARYGRGAAVAGAAAVGVGAVAVGAVAANRIHQQNKSGQYGGGNPSFSSSESDCVTDCIMLCCCQEDRCEQCWNACCANLPTRCWNCCCAGQPKRCCRFIWADQPERCVAGICAAGAAVLDCLCHC